MDVKYLVLLILLITACQPQSEVSKGNVAGSTNSETPTTDTKIPTSATQWNYLATTTPNIIVNVSNLNNAYIVGSAVENYLSTIQGSTFVNFSGIEYCAVSDYSLGGIKYQLRTRAVPTAYYDFTAKRTIRIFRVDFDDVTNSSALCTPTLMVQDVSGEYVVDTTAPASPVYAPGSICPSCTNMLTATRVRIFKRSSGQLLEVPTQSISLASLSLQIDPNYNVSGAAGTCTNTTCRARGFDCCLENQCVDDGATRPSATTLYFGQWQVAEQEKILNPLAYMNYPQLYYVCGTTPPSTTTGGDSVDPQIPQVNYDAGFEQLKKDYYCIENLKSQSSVSPFQTELMTKSYNPSTDCLTLLGHATQTQYYLNVVKRLYATCGCSRTTLTDMLASCPNYDYAVTLKDANGVPTRIDCYTPPSSVEVPTTQNVSVNSRSAPHRFFEKNNGAEKNIVGSEKTYVSGASTLEYEQEGSAFSYQDDAFLLPSQADFSMNAVLGQMTVSLSQALPAKVVTVEMDQVYMISTLSGYYTPCPTCSKDSWMSSFTAFPGSSNGAGLQAIGHTTERNAVGTNYTAGNYEDTIFGRACWVPPTMIPFTHVPMSSVKDQRRARLDAQAAFFINGYQRDWFGFNKGALIGSFDGVTWFAIGKGRIVKTTTKKLFLAINAPFADLATPSLHVVQIQNYDGFTQAAGVDYDPSFHLSHPYQNEAGNCQSYHQCNSDSDCITRLGWEYVCNDVKDVKTLWPEFDVDANEIANSGGTAITIDQILQQKRFAGPSTKRCVYRGAGAPCIEASGSITDASRKRNLTCAPNFYCANLNDGLSFNSKIARWGGEIQDIPVPKNHLYGKDANVLGRPLSYNPNAASIPPLVRTNIVENMKVYEASLATANTGMCQPARSLPTANTSPERNPFEAHKNPDPSKRSDYISQIGTCNSGFFNHYRYVSCPNLNLAGNYEMFDGQTTNPEVLTTLTPVDFSVEAQLMAYALRTRAQNACGLDSLNSTAVISGTPNADTLLSSSPFKYIEARPLPVSSTVADPTLVRDACYRRAGSVCHTDLDCSPNRMHSDQVDYFPKFFGDNNEAERSYWREYLTCSQATPKPLPSDAEAFKNYNMGLNRCCREIGKDLTTYTAKTPVTLAAGGAVYDPATDLDLPIWVTSPGTFYNNVKRYTRLATVENLGSSDRPYLSGRVDRSGVTLDGSSANIMTPKQWKTLNEVNTETCCGGGWIRKFSDGSNDWTKRNRLFIDVSNFKCINSTTALLTEPLIMKDWYQAPSSVVDLVNKDSFNYCIDSQHLNGGCAQFQTPDLPEVTNPDPTYAYGAPGQVFINTIVPAYVNENAMGITKNNDHYFTPESADGDAGITVDFTVDFTTNPKSRRNINLQIPSWVPDVGFTSVYEPAADNSDPLNIDVVDATGAVVTGCVKDTNAADLDILSNPYTRDSANTLCTDGRNCCYFYDKTTRRLKIAFDDAAGANAFPTIGVYLNRNTVGVKFPVPTAGGSGHPTVSPIPRSKPGSGLFYLQRLSKLELSGIPQIAMTALYCNDNSDRLVPGIFKETVLKYRSEMEAVAGTQAFTHDGEYHTTSQNLQSDPVFSAHQYKCCSKLGQISGKAENCCSGYGKPFGDGSAVTCALPPGTDLMVYFNRYVSNEGVDKNGPGGGLKETDFDDITGEPGLLKDTDTKYKIVTKVIDKIRALGNEYCDSAGKDKVRQGGAFGMYEPEPVGPRSNVSNKMFTIVDSTRDANQNSSGGATVTVGYNAFMDGFRWNHHLYCND